MFRRLYYHVNSYLFASPTSRHFSKIQIKYNQLHNFVIVDFFFVDLIVLSGPISAVNYYKLYRKIVIYHDLQQLCFYI